MNCANQSNRESEFSKPTPSRRRIGTGRVVPNLEIGHHYSQDYNGSDQRFSGAIHRNDTNKKSVRQDCNRSGQNFISHNMRSSDSSKLMGYQRLVELIDKYSDIPNDLLMNLESDNSFLNMISSNDKLKGNFGDYELICHAIKALAIIIKSERDLLLPYLSKMNEREFEVPIMKYLINFSAYLNKNKDLHLKAFDDLVRFVRQFQLIFPKASREKVSMICPHLEKVVTICNKKEDIISKETVALVNQIMSDITHMSEKLKLDDIEEVKEELMHSTIKPPNDFRDIPIYPTIEDIHQTGTPFLRSNIVKGKYVDVDHYLDVQFRLLREDFVRPLREGIAEYLNTLKSNKQVRRLKDLRLYSGVHIGVSYRLKDQLITEATFDTTPFKNLRWQFSKRLIYGSMLCLSSNNFETFCFATVAGKRDATQLAKGKFKLQFETLTEEFIKITPLTTLTVVESQAYFEAYRHNLSTLQSFTKEDFPLQDYIISVSNNVEHLPHLSISSNYDLSDLSVPLIKINSDNLRAKIESSDTDFSRDENISLLDAINIQNDCYDSIKQNRLQSVNILNDFEWPDNEICGFDDSQYLAYKSALTKQMVVIQGPPGTGKTYVGLRIVQSLLRNKRLWNNYEQTRRYPSPILIVCYTNHALDQFLEGMLPFVKQSTGMVRIGGRSQSDVLANYSLFSLKRKMGTSRNVPGHISRAINNCEKDLESIQTALFSAQTDIQKDYKELSVFRLRLTFKRRNTDGSLTIIMDQLQQLQEWNKNIDLALIEWLDIKVFVEQLNDEKNDETDVKESNEINEVTNDLIDSEVENELKEEEVDEQEIQQLMYWLFIEDEERTEAINRGSNQNKSKQITEDDETDVLYFKDIDVSNFEKLTESKRKQLQKQIEYELNSNDLMSEREAFSVSDIRNLLAKDRWRLYRYWRQLYCHEKQIEIEHLNRKYSDYMRQFNRLRVEEDLCIIRGCEVIGVTTTGAAKYRTIIEQIDPYIVVVEEAAEVLECHVVTALTKSTKHLILIGDHQQLKPNPTVYELAKKYNLEVSLFERMIKNGLPFHQLKVQHRMRPCISSLLVPHIYKELRDHESVNNYDHIRGISKNMFFINHSEIEASLNDTKSKLNKYEAEFIVRLARYLILQLYKPTQITILTMYSAQLFQVKQLIKSDSIVSGVRATVLDNYQGEECDIILLSFVRSNIEGDIGFLKVSNRVNVALSRARMGMYCIGNFDCLSEQSQLWKNIKNDLIESNAIGTALELICQKHNKKTLVSKGSDFSEVPEGGCLEPCNSRLDCGHVCPQSCHVYDEKHEKVVCRKECNKTICERNHRCPNKCHYGSDCQPCAEKVDKTRPSCGHRLMMKCSSDPNDVFCYEKCNRVLECGHKCTQVCGVDCNSTKCKPMVTVDAVCGHKVQIKCSKRSDIDLQLKSCTEHCATVLDCGHVCQGSCGQCQQSRLHKMCGMKCERTLICGHICRFACGRNCPPCRQKCQNRCLHSKCKRKCGVPCPPCQEKCVWSCVHKSCNQLCNEMCDRDMCSEPCPKLLKCAHSCIGICGEPCPVLCRICHKDQVQELFFGYEDEPDARFIQLEDCGHIIELNGLKMWLNQSNDNSGNNLELSGGENSETIAIQMKSCPKCKTIIRKTKLFNSSVQQSLRDVELVKQKQSFGNLEENKRIALLLRDEMHKYCLDVGGVDYDSSKTSYLTKNEYAFSRVGPKLDNLISQTYKKYISKTDLTLLRNKFEIIKKIFDTLCQLWNAKNKQNSNRNLTVIFKLIDATEIRIKKFLHYIDVDYFNNQQQISDSQKEINYLCLISETLKEINDKYFNGEAKKLLVEAFDLAHTFGPFTDTMKDQFKSLVDRAFKLEGGLGISLQEKNMILKAMDFRKGHWYKCPNGHIYCIGECGGATEQSICSECKAPIGGTSHRLLSNNSVATEMDGATQPAYGPHVPFDLAYF